VAERRSWGRMREEVSEIGEEVVTGDFNEIAPIPVALGEGVTTRGWLLGKGRLIIKGRRSCEATG